jgi:hypothetical protein
MRFRRTGQITPPDDLDYAGPRSWNMAGGMGRIFLLGDMKNNFFNWFILGQLVADRVVEHGQPAAIAPPEERPDHAVFTRISD